MQKFRWSSTLFILLCFTKTLLAQAPIKPNSVEIFNQIQKLNFLGTVLYIAAHPDDENTRLISYLSNNTKARTGYLSLTRGDGGQNLIGSELREGLGVIRTQELLEARKIDGGTQFFTRANDFGFSKNPKETLQIWDKDQVLSDVVWVIRKFQPDIIINRFDHRTPGTTHGHHTASAMLSVEAFDQSNNPTSFKNQLEYTSPWPVKRLFFNPSWYFFGSKEKFEKADKSNYGVVSIGTYYQSLGKSNQEIAALSRSCHKSQGFGTSGTRGEENEYFEFLKGEPLVDKNNLFEGIDTSWNRVKNGKPIGVLVSNIEKNFDFKNPSASIQELLKVYRLIQELDDNHWKEIKSEEIKKIISACAGLFLEATSEVQEVTPGSDLKVTFEAINRSNVAMKLLSLDTYPNNTLGLKPLDLLQNKDNFFTTTLALPDTLHFSNPYWLNDKGTVGMYSVSNQQIIGTAEVQREVKATFVIEINGVTIPFERNIVYKYSDDVKGEVYQPLDIVPLASSSIAEKVFVFNNQDSKKIQVRVKTSKDNVQGNVSLGVPENWTVYPKEIPFSIAQKGHEFIAEFEVTPSKNIGEFTIKSFISVEQNIFDKEKTEINYPHIYKQILLSPSESKAIRLDIKSKKKHIAYIMGAGDDVPKGLQQMGFEVSIVNPNDITPENLINFDVVMTGIRAYNMIKELEYKQQLLFDFVKSGKTMIVQYNTLDELVTPNIAPYPLKISRDRVTEENAEVRLLEPKHPILNYPNKITLNDFKGWKQEQGLYYPSEWDSHFTPILSSNDTDETPKNGALLFAKYGNGTYIYTGLSFFRELPEGVSGAYRLLANLISIEN